MRRSEGGFVHHSKLEESNFPVPGKVNDAIWKATILETI
jgi:hypothetical protein